MLLQLIVVRNHVIQVRLFYELFHSTKNDDLQKQTMDIAFNLRDQVKHEFLRILHEE